ncbi:MAG TPA: nuclear transport factor 2 family protein [Blastocatellia bacterium]|nr:nuclear transport factor 2 family protein [Blastocatellia bacterium]
MMKSWFVVVAAISLAVANPCPSPARAATPTGNLQQQIRGVLDDQVTAWNRGDLEGFMKGYWRSPKLSFFSGANRLAGWQETLNRYQQRYKSEGREMGQLEFSDIEIEMLGTASAFVRGKWHLKMGSGEAGGLFTLVFRRFSQGWKIVHDHTSAA